MSTTAGIHYGIELKTDEELDVHLKEIENEGVASHKAVKKLHEVTNHKKVNNMVYNYSFLVRKAIKFGNHIRSHFDSSAWAWLPLRGRRCHSSGQEVPR